MIHKRRGGGGGGRGGELIITQWSKTDDDITISPEKLAY